MKKSDPIFLYIALILIIAFEQFACKVAYTVFPNAPSQLGSRMTEIIMLFGGIYLWKNTAFVQPGLGMNVPAADRKKTVLHTLVLGASAFVLLIFARIIGQQVIPGMAQRPYFGLYLNYPHRVYYPIVVIVQEVLSKAVLQYGLEKTLPEDKWILAVIVSGAIFGMLHIQISALLMLGAFALAVASGIYYHYQKNIWAIAVMHYIFGFFARSFGLIV